MVSEEKIKKSVSKSNFSILKFLKRRFFLAYLLKIYCFWIVKKCWKPYVSNTFLFPIISYQTTTGNYNNKKTNENVANIISYQTTTGNYNKKEG